RISMAVGLAAIIFGIMAAQGTLWLHYQDSLAFHPNLKTRDAPIDRRSTPKSRDPEKRTAVRAPTRSVPQPVVPAQEVPQPIVPAPADSSPPPPVVTGPDVPQPIIIEPNPTVPQPVVPFRAPAPEARSPYQGSSERIPPPEVPITSSGPGLPEGPRPRLITPLGR
ncbi:MAG: hypothetical protein AAF236_08465, partial [Verrucomicrobiota bacterium]